MSQLAVVVFQAFLDNTDDFIVKELAVVSAGMRCQIVFKPPYSYDQLNYQCQRSATRLANSYHYIDWDEGDVPYSLDLIRDVMKPFDEIYTEGPERAGFLKRFHRNVRHVEERAEDRMTAYTENTVCVLPEHRRGGRCAMKIAVDVFRRLQSETVRPTQSRRGDQASTENGNAADHRERCVGSSGRRPAPGHAAEAPLPRCGDERCVDRERRASEELLFRHIFQKAGNNQNECDPCEKSSNCHPRCGPCKKYCTCLKLRVDDRGEEHSVCCMCRELPSKIWRCPVKRVMCHHAPSFEEVRKYNSRCKLYAKYYK